MTKCLYCNSTNVILQKSSMKRQELLLCLSCKKRQIRLKQDVTKNKFDVQQSKQVELRW